MAAKEEAQEAKEKAMVEEMLGPKGFQHFQSTGELDSVIQESHSCQQPKESLSLLRSILPQKYHDRI